jgi:hypothetical protein
MKLPPYDSLSRLLGGVEAMEGQRKRPVWVWVIAVYLALSASFTAFSYYAVFSGKIPVAPAQQAYFAALTPLDHAMTAVIFICVVCGGVSLFLLRKIAVQFFIAALVCNASLTLWQALGGRPVPAGLIGIIVGLLLVLSITLYAANLAKKHILT